MAVTLRRHVCTRAMVACVVSCASAVQAGSVSRRALAAAEKPDEVGAPVGAILGTVFALCALALAVVGFVIRHRRKKVAEDAEAAAKGQGKEAEAKAGKEEATPQTSLIYMTFNDVQVATEGFKPEGLLSESPFATVHKGEGPSGEQWAIKCAKEVSLQGEHLFRNEVEFLARIAHENIVPLRGFCDEGDEQILVFDFMPNGSLASWLRPPPEDTRPALTLMERFSVAVGVADALRFLHSFSQPKIIHRDLQSNSILLDANLKPRVGGLGLLKHLPGDTLRLRMAGKKGYLDPEYFQTFKVTTKCDVYAFGVVLFELLTGCAPMVSVSRSETQRTFTLSQWAKQAVEEGKLEEILDPKMPREEDPSPPEWQDLVEGLARVACACVAPLRRHRPDMAKVAEQLAKLGSKVAGHLEDGSNQGSGRFLQSFLRGHLKDDESSVASSSDAGSDFL